MATASLSPLYEQAYGRLLGKIAIAPKIRPRELTYFWPKVGAQYDHDLLVVGRAVNGWIDRWDLDQSGAVTELAAQARKTGDRIWNGDPMGWILEAWNRREGYNSARSQFWKTARQVTIERWPDREADWPSYLAWTNLCKVAPWTRGNPAGPLLKLQRVHGPALLRLEVAELSPRRVVVFAGRGWFEPFVEPLGLTVQWREGLVEGVADDEAGRRWVIAVHPMTRSPAKAAEAVCAAFAE